MEDYVVYRMATMSMTLSDPKDHFCCLKPFYLPYDHDQKYSMYY